MPLNNVIGSPVVGADFFDRHEEQARIWRRLEHDSILLLAPRRVGKTSLLHRLEETAEQLGELGYDQRPQILGPSPITDALVPWLRSGS